jgi:hypothetical protein
MVHACRAWRSQFRFFPKLSWQQYHKQHAVLRLISEEGHKQLTAQQNRQQSKASTSGAGGNRSSRGAGRQSGAGAPAGSVDDVADLLAQLRVQQV